MDIEPAGTDQCAWSFCAFCWGDPRISATRRPNPTVGYGYHICRECAAEHGINLYDRPQVDRWIRKAQVRRPSAREKARKTAEREASA